MAGSSYMPLGMMNLQMGERKARMKTKALMLLSPFQASRIWLCLTWSSTGLPFPQGGLVLHSNEAVLCYTQRL